MLKIEQIQGYDERPHFRCGFRHRWLERRVYKSDADIDYAYSLVLAWVCAGEKNHIQENFTKFWERAVDAYGYPSMWRRVERVAQRLIQQGELSIRATT